MAWLPAGAAALLNPVGTAAGVPLESGTTTIICLPGVPAELKGIFATSLQPFLRETFRGGLSVLRTVTVQCNDESVMEPALTRVAGNHPAVYIKSLATAIDENRDIDIVISATGHDEESTTALLQAAMLDLQAGLKALGIGYREKPAIFKKGICGER